MAVANEQRPGRHKRRRQTGRLCLNRFLLLGRRWRCGGAELSSPTDAMVADAILLLNGTDQGMTAVLGKEMMNNI
jgi:hypothetical protein